MVKQKTTYETEVPKANTPPYWLYGDQVAANREEAVIDAKSMCDDDCSVAASLDSRDMLWIECDARIYDSQQAAEAQETICRAAQIAIWNSIEGQAALVREANQLEF